MQIKYKVNELALFGSYARGTAKPNSDIDIIFNFEKEVSLEVEGEIQLILENLLENKKVDLTLSRNLHESLRKEIEEHKLNVIKKI